MFFQFTLVTSSFHRFAALLMLLLLFFCYELKLTDL